MTRLALLGAAAVLGAALPAAGIERPRKEPEAKTRACPEIGEGYVRIPGTDTCVRVGGSVRAEGAAIRGGR